MAIRKTDGSNYNVGGRKALQSYRPDGQDIKLLDEWDQEQINLAGSPIIYYPCYIDTDYDTLYMESVDSIIAQEGYRLICQFEPVRPTQDLGAFGIDSPDEVLFNFNLTKWKEIVGEMPRVKSLLFAEWDKTFWEIIQGNLENPFKLWSKFRLEVIARKYQPSRSETHPTRKDSKDNSLNIELY